MLEITEMTEADLDGVAAIEAEVFSMPWSKKGFADTLGMDNVIFLVAREGGEIKGYCGLYQAADEGEITNVAVAPADSGSRTGCSSSFYIWRMNAEHETSFWKCAARMKRR